MQYCLEMGLWQSVFAVPRDLIDKHIKLAGKEQLKTILWMLAHGGEPLSPEQIAAATGISPESAEDSIRYWLNSGFIQAADAPSKPAAPAQTIASSAASTVNPPAAPPPSPVKTPAPPIKKKRLIKPGGHYVATRIMESPEVQYLIQESQTVLGKTLSPALSSALVAIYEDYGLPVEVIMMLVQYAKECGKTGTSYIEAVARDWYESNIFTLESAEQKLSELSEMRMAWRKFVSAVGINDRPPSKREETLVHDWFYRFRMTPDMISEAYERCVNATGKLSMSYMNKIIEKWDQFGYHTVEQVHLAEQQRKERITSEKSYNIEEVEKTGFFDPMEDF